jgi:hypothetical protein
MTRIACSIAATCLMAAEFAAAQTNASAKLPKDVKSEVLSLRPVKPAASLAFTDRPTPNGYRATLSIWQAIMRGYTTDDNVTWGATQIKNTPGNTRAAGRSCSALSCAPRYETAANWQSTKDRPGRDAGVNCRQGRTPFGTGSARRHATRPRRQIGQRRHRHRRAAGRPDRVALHSATTGDLVQFLEIMSNRRSVYDETGLTGRYDFTF